MAYIISGIGHIGRHGPTYSHPSPASSRLSVYKGDTRLAGCWLLVYKTIPTCCIVDSWYC